MLTKSKVPNIISGIIATGSIAVFGFLMLPSLWFWVAWEVVAAALVAIGCGGEWYLFKNPSKEGHELHHRKRELQSIAAVTIGVCMEFFALAHAIPEAVRLEKEVAESKERSKWADERILKLEIQRDSIAKQLADTKLAATNAMEAAQTATNVVHDASETIRPRRLSKEQQTALLRAIRPFPKANFTFFFDHIISDAKGLAGDIAPVFIYDGWQLLPVEEGSSTFLEDKIEITGGTNNGPTIAAIADGLTSCGLPARAITNMGTWKPDPNLPPFSNVIIIIVGYKAQK